MLQYCFCSLFLFFVFLFLFATRHVVILAPQPGMRSKPLHWKVNSLNHWTARDISAFFLLLTKYTSIWSTGFYLYIFIFDSAGFYICAGHPGTFLQSGFWPAPGWLRPPGSPHPEVPHSPPGFPTGKLCVGFLWLQRAGLLLIVVLGLLTVVASLCFQALGSRCMGSA